MDYNIYNNLKYNEDYTICYGPTSKQISEVNLHENTRVIAESAFLECKNFQEINFPAYLEEIGFRAFENTELTYLVTPPLLNKIGKEAFEHCENLMYVDFSESKNLTFLDEDVFESCYCLKNIIISKNMKEIKDRCFAYCGFEKINFPESIEILGDSTFFYCDNLKKINFTNTKVIDAYCFSHCKSLEEVTFSNNLIFLANGAFSVCINLKHLDMPKNLPLSDNPFMDCKDLVLYIDDSKRKEYEKIFKNCDGISLKEKNMEYYINTGKSFKEINNIFKNIER